MRSPERPSIDERHAAWLGVCIALACGASYVFRSAPTTYLLDSSELVATTWSLAVSHAPGHPAYHMIAYPFVGLPLGTMAYRVHLFSAVATALSVGLLPWCASRLGWVETRGRLAAVALIALAIGQSSGFAMQSIRAEVYALNLLAVTVATCAVASRDDALDVRRIGLVAVALGVGLLDHHYLVLWTFPAFLAATLIWRGPFGARLRALAIGTCLGVATLLGYAYLLARGAARPAIGWGWPSGAGDLWWILSAQAFQKTATRAVEMDMAAGAQNTFGVITEQLTFFGVGVALLGLGLLVTRRPRAAVFLVLAIAGNLVTQLLLDFDPSNPDVLGYFMPAIWWLALCACCLVCSIRLPGRLRSLSSAASVVFASAIFVAALSAGLTTDRTTTLARYWDSEVFRDEVFAMAPPETLWITTYFETGFDTWYAQAVEDRRPDMVHVHQAFRTYPFYDRMALAMHPDLADLFGEPSADELLTTDALLTRARTRPVRIEPEHFVGARVAGAAIPVGTALQLMPGLVGEGELPGGMTAATLAHYQELRDAMGRPAELQTRRNLLWNSFNMARVMCAAGRAELCRELAGFALELSPDDPDLRALAGQGGAGRPPASNESSQGDQLDRP